MRFYGLNWDEGTGQHPDERHVLMSASRLEWPKSAAEYLSEPSSPLNPRNRGAHFYAYGTLPTTLLRAVGEFGGITKPEHFSVAGRVLAVLADLTSIALIFLFARTLYRTNGIPLFAAFLYSMAVLPIQHAHFFVVDPFANAFIALALWLLARAWRGGRWYEYALTGVALGLALSCKISVATFGLPVGLVALLPAAGLPARGWIRTLLIASLRVGVFLLATILTVRIALPDAFSGLWPWQLAPRWLANMREVVNISTGYIDIPFTRQFYGRLPLLWPWWNMVVWGLGLGLGLSAWAAWAVALLRIIRQRVWMHLIPVAWVATVFFHQAFTYQATLRYFLPIYGCLCVLAAWGLTRVAGAAFRGEGAWAQRPAASFVALCAPLVVAGFTVAWAFGFLSIYAQSYTRVEASRWIYEHIPAGTAIGCEHWDDFLPLPLPGTKLGPTSYQQIEMLHYVADEPNKRGQLLATLNRVQYLILASQKLRDSIPRMPHRYPFTISYYEGLEDGTLGFDKVAEFKRDFRFLGFRISTRGAEEAFSVYDHPPVVIYKKAARYNPDQLVTRFNAIPLDGVTDTREPQRPQPGSVRRAQSASGLRSEPAILIAPERWALDQQRSTWSEMFDRASFVARHSVVVWVAHLLALQFIGWGLLFPLLRALPDRGAALARPFAILLPLWLQWLLASKGLGLSTRGTYWQILAAFALLSALLVWRQRAQWRLWWAEERGAALRAEAVFWGAFALFLAIRTGNPDLWHPAWGGEKPMEMTFLNGVMRSEEFPPLNPWFAGGFINYYYFGFVLCGGLIKGLGVLPEVGFNLCLATFFGLGCAAAFSAARALRPVGSWVPAWAASLFAMVLGNSFELRFIWNRCVVIGAADHDLKFPLVSDVIRAVCGAKRVFGGEPLSPYLADLYWVAARAISVKTPNEVPPITEFPFWSFLYADLHPHLIALPFTLCVVTLLAAWVRSVGFRVKTGLTLLIGFTLGFFWPTNTWDWPTYGALTGLTLFAAFWSRDRVGTVRGFVLAMVKSLTVFVIMLAVGYLAFRPFHQSYVAGYGAFERWLGDRTSLRDYLFIYALFLFILGSAFAAAWTHGDLGIARSVRLLVQLVSPFGPEAATRRRRVRRLVRRRPVALVPGFVALGGGLVFAASCVLGVLPGILIISTLAAGMVAWNFRLDLPRVIPALMVLLAFALCLMVELVVLVGDIGRMNTVFKFYYQVWVLLAVASALSLPLLVDSWKTWPPRVRRVWMTAFVLLLASSSLYPLLATPTKIRDRFVATPPTLDGLAFAEKAEYFLQSKTFPLRPDLLAIRWLEDHVKGTPVLLEMNTGTLLYTWGSRYAVHTGLPTLAGWSWHQRQQQAGIADNRVDTRIAETQLMYRTPDVAQTRALLAKYGVKLVVVGELERLFGTPEGIAKFASMGLEKIYDAEGVTIYRVP